MIANRVIVPLLVKMLGHSCNDVNESKLYYSLKKNAYAFIIKDELGIHYEKEATICQNYYFYNSINGYQIFIPDRNSHISDTLQISKSRGNININSIGNFIEQKQYSGTLFKLVSILKRI